MGPLLPHTFRTDRFEGLGREFRQASIVFNIVLAFFVVTVPFEQGKTLLLPRFMNLMLDCYSYTPVIPTNSKGPGYPKYINIMDPLLHSNNLGRSVSKTSSIRIKNAFGYGARQLHNLFNKVTSKRVS